MPSPVVWDELRRLSQGNWPVTAAEAIIGPPRRGPRQQPTTRLTSDDIKGPVASLRDITATLAAADPGEKAKVYAEMGIDVTYHQDGRVVVESRPRGVESGVGGAFRDTGRVSECGRVQPSRRWRCAFSMMGAVISSIERAVVSSVWMRLVRYSRSAISTSCPQRSREA